MKVRMLVLGAVLLLIAGAPTWATVLDFNIDGIGDAGHLYSIQDGYNYYGNKVASAGTRLDWVKDASNTWVEATSTYAEGDTPNIQILYHSNGNTEWYSSDIYGDLVNWVYDDTTGDPGTGYICGFQPEAGWQVVIESFDVAHYETGDETANIQISSWNPTDGEIVLWESGNVTISGSTHTTFTPNFTGAYSGNEYWIRFDSGTSGVYYYGFDNIAFSQVPEPATMALLGLGALMLKRKRS